MRWRLLTLISNITHFGAVKLVERIRVDPKFVHTANSAATLRFQGITFNAVRIGIAMYGLSPSVEIRPFTV